VGNRAAFEALPQAFADFPLGRLTAKTIRVLRDRRADLPEAADGRVKAIRRVFAWDELVATNPARDVAYKRRPTQGHHTWTEDELRQVFVAQKGRNRKPVTVENQGDPTPFIRKFQTPYDQLTDSMP
jgi:hypothetical protein